MIYCKELNKEFSDKEKMFSELMENKETIIANKKAEIYKSIDKGLHVITSQKQISKIASVTKEFSVDDDYYYFVVNSSRVLDSHKDVHLDGNWEKTVKEQQGKTYLVFDHELKRSEIIAMKKDVEMLTAVIPFSMIGKEYDGDTYCLIYKVKKDKVINADAKEWLEKGYDFECSVRMQYMDIIFCADTNSQGYEKELENFNTYYPQIANKEDFEEIYYFWGIKQAKNVYESSLLLFGSNPATGLVQENKEAVSDTSQNEPSNDTQSELIKLLSNIKIN